MRRHRHPTSSTGWGDDVTTDRAATVDLGTDIESDIGAADLARTVRTFVVLRWRLLRGAVRRGGADRAGVVVSSIASAVIGVGLGTALAVSGRIVDDRAEIAVIACSAVLLAVLGFGIVAGVVQPIDPRVVAVEALPPRHRALAVLAAAAAGPPGLSAVIIGIGLAIGTTHRWSDAPVVVVGVVAWLGSLLLVARTATNLLALVLNRFPRGGQFLVGICGFVCYGGFQFLPPLFERLDPEQRDRLVEVVGWTPPGRIGLAVADGTGWDAVTDLVTGSAWLMLLAPLFVWSDGRLAAATRHHRLRRAGQRRRPTRLLLRWCGTGPVGAVARRSLLLRFREPRTAIETVLGGAIGLAAVLAPTLLDDDPGSGAVLVGGAVQLAVLFMAGNSFGNDGPALAHEFLTGAEPGWIVAGKSRSVVIVGAPLAVVGPLVAASVTGAWQYLPAGWCIGVAGVLAGTGAAMIQSAYVPIAIPPSDHPFVSGESGKGVVAALLLAGVLTVLAVVTVPVALGLLWASDRGRIDLVTLLAATAILIGWAVAAAGRRLAVHHLTVRQPEFLAALVPAR